VLLLHRKTDEDTHVQCRVAKNRDGGLGSFNLIFLAEYVTFEELDEKHG
jgi:replicative DNA helicase